MALICIYLATNDIKMLNIFFMFIWHLCIFFRKITQSFAISIGSVLLIQFWEFLYILVTIFSGMWFAVFFSAQFMCCFALP